MVGWWRVVGDQSGDGDQAEVALAETDDDSWQAATVSLRSPPPSCIRMIAPGWVPLTAV